MMRVTSMSEAAVQDILSRIERLSEEDRALLEQLLAERVELEWRQAAQEARQAAVQRGLDQTAIDRAIHELRYPQ